MVIQGSANDIFLTISPLFVTHWHAITMSSPPRLGKSRIVPGGGAENGNGGGEDQNSPRAHAAADVGAAESREGDDAAAAGPSTSTSTADGPNAEADSADRTADDADEEEEVDDDPNLLASYPIYLSNSLPSTSETHLFQYPTYPRRQPLPVPSSSRQRGLQQAIRWRKNAGWVQVELPLDLRRSVYDEEKGGEMGRGASHLGSEIGSGGGDGGVAGDLDSDGDEKIGGKKRRKESSTRRGKSKAAASPELNDTKTPKRLEKIRLESDLMPNMTKYCVGVMRDHALHLTQLDRIVQLRPSMHHLDGLDAIDKEEKRNAARLSAQTDDEESEAEKKPAGAKAPAQGFNVAVRVAGGRDGAGGGGMTDRGDALMAAQHRAEAESWLDLQWRDLHGGERDKQQVQEILSSQLFAGSKTRLTCATRAADYLPSVEAEGV